MIIDIVTISFEVNDDLMRTITSINNISLNNNVSINHIIVLKKIKNFKLINTKYSKIILFQNNTGIYSAFNLSIKYLKGEYCIFMNSGDQFFDGKIFEIFNSKKINNIKILIGNFAYCYSEKLIAQKLKKVDIKSIFTKKTTLSQQAIFYHKSLFELDSFNVKYLISSDFDFNLRNIYKNKTMLTNTLISILDSNGLSNKKRFRSNIEDLIVRIKFINKSRKISYLPSAFIIFMRDLLSSFVHYILKLIPIRFDLINKFRILKYTLKFFGNRNEIVPINKFKIYG